ncbi:glycosyltransferase [Tautonia sociabilis]|uniref:Glycosyltransferase family 2 protein n=1 Tax=Tautonia sociabilis TaxID=2080755 RepID=A0A432MGN2_9BACT|nr:glycosyltransferase family 2 protein [Tautonia sociabilis]RUL85739.1 glycosyltransferase family 2 protein [Tautonia sociabilis]
MIAGRSDSGCGPTPPALAVVIVNFNSWPDTARLVAEIAGGIDPALGRCEVVVVDNASDDPPPALLGLLPGVRLICRPDNAGFAAGVNTAWRSTAARWLLLLNPDVLAGADLLPLVLGRIALLEARPEGPPGVVGFALRNEDGSRQHSVGPFPTLLGCLREVVTPRSRRKYRPLRRTRTGPVPWVTGACMLVHSELLRDLGGMDEDFFLYHEEVALCRSARDLGRSVEFDDAVEVAHLRPLQARAVSPMLRVVTRHSKLLYFLKHRPRFEFAALARLVAAEAALGSLRCRLLGRPEEGRAWRAVSRIARELGPGRGPRGIEVLAFADRAIRGAEPTRTPRRRRPIPLDAAGRSR